MDEKRIKLVTKILNRMSKYRKNLDIKLREENEFLRISIEGKVWGRDIDKEMKINKKHKEYADGLIERIKSGDKFTKEDGRELKEKMEEFGHWITKEGKHIFIQD